MTIAKSVSVLGIAGLALATIPACNAATISYTFSVTATTGPLAGTTASGTFSYDSSSIVLGGPNCTGGAGPDCGQNNSTGLFTSLNFTWDSISYGLTTADTGFLEFNAYGTLIDPLFGRLCSKGTCANVNGVESWWVSAYGGFHYTMQGTIGLFEGTAALTPQPTILPGGIVNAASYAAVNGVGSAVAPGSLVAIFTSPLPTQAGNFTGANLPPALSNVSVTFNGITAPIVAVSPTGPYPYVSVQVPFEVLSQGQTSASVPVVVTVNSFPGDPQILAGGSTPVQASIVASAPGIFTFPATGLGNAILVNLSDNSVAAPAGSIPGFTTHPIARGQNAYFYVSGLGAKTPEIQDGSGNCNAPNSRCNANANPTVLVGGISAQVNFAGQAPGFPGVDQVNITIPQNAPTGNAVTLVATSADGSVSSNSATIAIQ